MASICSVMIVEEKYDLCSAMAEFLRRGGYSVIEVCDGTAAEEMLRSNLPDLIIVDMLLPGSSGFSVLRTLREISDSHIPAIMISRKTLPAHINYAQALGVEVFLTEPFHTSELYGMVSDLCPLSQMERNSFLAAVR